MYKLFCFFLLTMFLIFNYSCDPTDTVDALENSDLVIDSFYITPSDANTEDSVTFHCFIRNQGLGGSDPTRLRMRVGGEAIPPEFDVPAITSGNLYEVTRVMRLPLALTYLAIATIDHENVVTETNEENNIDSLIFRINPPPRANLIVDTIIHRPESPTIIDSITFTINVTNIGESISDSSKVSLKVGGESIPPKYDIPPMYPGDVFSVTRKMLLPIALTYLAIANVDCDNEEIESNELDNLDSLIFRVNPGPKPNLKIDTIFTITDTPNTVDSIAFRIRVSNDGEIRSNPCKLSYKVGGEAIPPKYDIPVIEPGATHTIQRSMLLPIALTYLGIATIDCDGTILETDETDNVDSLIFSVITGPKPNLTVDTILISPTMPTQDDSITFSIRVSNQGERISDTSSLSFKVGGESMPPKYPIPQIHPGGIYTVNRKMLLPLALTYLGIATVDCNGSVVESNELDNIDSLIFRVLPRPKPNLTVDSIVYSPTDPTVRDSITFSITVNNEGPVISDTTSLSFKVGGESMPPKYPVPQLPVGGSYTISRKMLLPISLTYLAIATIDCNGSVLESDESDNVDSLIFRINPAPKPNLIVDNISMLPTLPTTEDSITFSLRVRNIGEETSDTTRLAFKVGGESIPPQYPIPSLPAGSNYTVTRKMLLPIALTYLSIATIDNNNNVLESNELDNVDSLIFSVVRPEQSDLEIIGFSTTPVTPTVYDSINFSVMIRNRGERASGETTLRLKVGGESIPPQFDVPSLLSGETFTVERKMILPIAQRYLAIATIDPEDLVDEVNESNNIDSLIFAVDELKLPDFQVMSISILPLRPTPKDSITISTIIMNNGPGIAPVGEVKINITGEKNPAIYEIPKLTVGATHTIKRKVLLQQIKEYEILVNVDHDSLIEEANEKNNDAKLNFFVSDVKEPNLIIESFYIKPSAPSTSDSIELMTIIKNVGNAKSNPCKAAVYVDTETMYDLIDVPALVSGATHSIQKRTMINTKGLHTAYAIIDTNNEVSESNEDDNRSNIEFIVETQQPDLHIKSLILNPSSSTAGQQVTITAVIENIGTGDADSSKASIKINGETSSLDEYDIPKLNRDSSFTIEKITTFNSNRVFTIVALADANNDVTDEISEGNNSRSIEIDVTNSLLAYYNFTTQGDTIYDSSSNGYHGKNNSVISAVDPFGNNTTAGGFDSYSSHVEVEKQLTPLSGHKSWTVTFWQINYSTPPGPYMTVLNFGNNANNESVWIGFDAVSGNFRAGFWGGQKESSIVKSEPYGPGYKFFGISYDHITGNAICMSSDGQTSVKDTLDLGNGISPNVNPQQFIIGKEIGINGANYLSGGLDELRIYKSALTFEEMEKLMGN